MSYLHISNLYKSQDILLFRECWALEKVHGTSAHIQFETIDNIALPGYAKIRFFSGGESHDRFKALFDETKLTENFVKLGVSSLTIYGEAYGGKCQGMKATYGPELCFIAFDVMIDGKWLDVPKAYDVASQFGIEFVPFSKVSTDLATLDAYRDAPSDVAKRRGITEPRPREGIVLRPLIELMKNNDTRVIAKHKGEAFDERATPQKVIDPARLAVLENARAIADEWVTEMRLTHVLDKLPQGISVDSMKLVIDAMIEDVMREAQGEIVDSKEARAAIGRHAATLFSARVKSRLDSHA